MKKIAIQGIKGSFHDNVASQIFGAGYNGTYCSDFAETVRAVESNLCDYGVIAIENSLVGSILENYKLLRNAFVEIISEEYLKIEHHLLALPGQKITDIKAVISHEMALRQCRDFMDLHKITDRRSFRDTASAIRHIGVNRIEGLAAIGSREAGQIYGLEILANDIQNNGKNYTRFLVIKKQETDKTNSVGNKATIVFSVLNEPGKLAMVLDFLNKKKVNLTKIESVPHLTDLGKFDMITDLELPDNLSFKEIAPELNHLVEEIKILGIYDKKKEPWIPIQSTITNQPIADKKI